MTFSPIGILFDHVLIASLLLPILISTIWPAVAIETVPVSSETMKTIASLT
jgi:hypothetical protein